MDVLVAGGGIAGLTLALTCHEIGVPVRVLEAAPEIQPLGLGINLQPEAVRELFDLRLESTILGHSIETTRLVLYDSAGVEIWSEPRGTAAGCRWPQLSVHRGDLQMMLLAAVIDRLGPEAVVEGRSIAGFAHARDGVRVEVTDLEDSVEQVDAPVLIGADGLHSAVRSTMFPGEGTPRWGGSVLWRGMAHVEPRPELSAFTIVGDATQRFVTCPLSAPDPTTGLQPVNWIAEIAFDPLRGWRRGDWNTRVRAGEFVDRFADWRFHWLDVPELVTRSETVFEYPMVDRDPVDHWVHGSVALVGDAAHPMYPVGSNGASQAIVDVRVLGAAFAEHGIGEPALREYQSRLLARRSEMTMTNRELGPGSVLGTHDRDLALGFVRMLDMSGAGRERFASDLRAAASSEIEALNSRPPTIDRTNSTSTRSTGRSSG